MTPITTQTLENALTAKLMVSFGKTAAEATDGEMMRASALVLRDMMALREVETRQKARQQHARQVHYLSLEFLMGRSLMKNAYNLGLLPQLREALEHLGFKAADIFEIEPDAALGNGGLGRLAACYLDSMTTLEIPATGYSICYELGIFKQKIVEGQQVELPDNWKDLGAAWLMPKPAETQEVRFGGTVREFWDNGHLHIVNEDATVVQAVPCDMEIAGYGTEHVNVLRLWDARSTQPVDMSLFSRGEYLKAAEDEAMAETIAKVLYPEDNHLEGKSLRLKQQYFFVSATLQSIAAKHTELYGTMKNFHEKNVIQINDTHPALVIPELMRILIDDAGMDWDEAWDEIRGLHQPHGPFGGAGTLAPEPGGIPAAPGVADYPGDLPPLAEEGGGLLPRPQEDGENGHRLGRSGPHGQPLHRRRHGGQRRQRPTLRDPEKGRFQGRLRHGALEIPERHQRH